MSTQQYAVSLTLHPKLFREHSQVVRAMTFDEDVDGERVQEMTRRLSPVVEIQHIANSSSEMWGRGMILIGSTIQAELKGGWNSFRLAAFLVALPLSRSYQVRRYVTHDASSDFTKIAHRPALD